MTTHQKNPVESLREREIAVFWDEMASFLPKSLEREALGDEKIFRAFRAVYPKIKEHFFYEIYKELEEEYIQQKLKKRAIRCIEMYGNNMAGIVVDDCINDFRSLLLAKRGKNI